MIEVRLFANFRDNRDKKVFLNANDFSDVQQILDHIGIKNEEVAILLVNGIHSKAEMRLKDEDIVALFPPIAGG
ncbi:MAG TPA: molybdopterin synthase sulfur carrier subunit [Erysipelotrichaceae bacterium]|nr:molybdopterin synthase sulfur carrier subunit [Erysipelotrichaceae bacterium]